MSINKIPLSSYTEAFKLATKHGLELKDFFNNSGVKETALQFFELYDILIVYKFISGDLNFGDKERHQYAILTDGKLSVIKHELILNAAEETITKAFQILELKCNSKRNKSVKKQYHPIKEYYSYLYEFGLF